MMTMEDIRTHNRADNNNKIKHIPRFLEVVLLQYNNLKYGFQNKDTSEDKIGYT